MITELMMLLIAVGVGIVVIAWTNTRRRKQDNFERREVEESTGKLKQELERTANEIIGRMENHVTHLEKVLDESERNRAQLEGRVVELRKLLKKGEGQSGEIQDLLARLDDASSEVNAMQRKMDVVERKLNLALSTPLPIQQPVPIPQITPPSLVTPIIPQPVTQITPPISTPPVAKVTPPVAKPAQIAEQPVTTTTTPPAELLNPLGSITVPPIIKSTTPESKIEPPPIVKDETEKSNSFDRILEEKVSELPPVEKSARLQARSSIILSPDKKTPVKAVEADPVKIESTHQKLTDASAKMAENLPEEVEENQAQTLRRRRAKSYRAGRDVRKAALAAIREAEIQSTVAASTPIEEPQEIILPAKKEYRPERRDLKLETTDVSIIKEMLLAGMTIEDISRETGLGRGAIELVQEMTRRQLERR